MCEGSQPGCAGGGLATSIHTRIPDTGGQARGCQGGSSSLPVKPSTLSCQVIFHSCRACLVSARGAF